MPHAVSRGLSVQALILCGPGSSFPTFTANPDENPKALLPIANRPMVWYPIDFCGRAGITDITLVCPPSAAEAIKTALKTNPFLTSLPTPSVLAPRGLDQTTGTAAVLRLPEVRELVTTDFLVLPCDLVCELGAEKLLQLWMARAASLSDLMAVEDSSYGGGGGYFGSSFSNDSSSSSARRQNSGGLAVWYDTRGGIPTVKSEEKDFVATVPSPGGAPYLSKSSDGSSSTPDEWGKGTSLFPYVERVVTAMPTDSLNDLTEEKGSYSVRHSLLRRHRRVRMRTTHRDAHIYVFPHWVMDFVQTNEHMDSIGEDVIGWWAKAEWQRGLPKKLGMDHVLQTYNGALHGGPGASGKKGAAAGATAGNTSADPDGSNVTSAEITDHDSADGHANGGLLLADDNNDATKAAAAAVAAPEATATTSLSGTPSPAAAADSKDDSQKMPPLLAYVHPSVASAPLIRRVDTSQLLLTVSLQLAKLPSIEEAMAVGTAAAAISPLAHARKVAYPEGVKPRTTITRQDTLVANNVMVEEKVSLKECVVGANCQIHEGAKLQQCLLMEGVVVGKGCRLTRCILGKRSEIGAGSVLTDCEVQENLLVEPKTEEKDNNFMSSDGMEATAEEMDAAMQSDSTGSA